MALRDMVVAASGRDIKACLAIYWAAWHCAAHNLPLK